MMRTVLFGVFLFCTLQLTSAFVSASSTYHQRIISELRGGYDATIGADPSTPLQESPRIVVQTRIFNNLIAFANHMY